MESLTDGTTDQLENESIVGPPIDRVAQWRLDPSVATMERLRDGESDAFRILFEQHRRATVAFAERLLRSRERAEEAAQAVFLQLFLSRARYQPKARFSTFLYRITVNVCLNMLRRAEFSQSIESLDGPSGPNAQDEDVALIDRLVDVEARDPEQRVSTRETVMQITQAIDRLPPTQRRALWLSRVEGRSYREVGDRLDRSIGSVKSLIFRATSALKNDLADIRWPAGLRGDRDLAALARE